MSTLSLFAPDPSKGSGVHPRSGEDIQFLGNNLQLAAIPVITFYFATAKGFSADTLPNSVSMHLPGAGISISSLQNFSTEESVAGAGVAGTLSTPEFSMSGVAELIGAVGQTVTSSLVRTVLDGLVGTAGFATSAGGSGISQVEFLLRQTFNNFQQLIYKGPTHRVFQLPFSMKPSSATEAEDVRDIVLAFKMASSPSIAEFDPPDGTRTLIEREATATAAANRKEGEELSAQEQQQLQSDADQGIVESARELGLIGPEPLLFNYPDMTSFALDLYIPSSDRLVRLFESEFCVMTALNVDYGENKLNFFKEANGKYYPTETTLSLSLTEHIHYFKENAIRSHDRGFTIL